MENSILILSSEKCPPCRQLKMFLTSKSITFENIDIYSKNKLIEELKNLSNSRSIPQVFIRKEGEIKYLFSGLNLNKIKELENYG